MQPWTSTRPAPVPPTMSAPAPTTDRTPEYYVPIPRRLVEDLRDAPIAIAAFALIARIFRATRQPVPLSSGDLQIFDPTLSDSAAGRALTHIGKTNWVIVEPRLGYKSTFTPTWGKVLGEPCPWDLQAPCLGRPRHVPALRLDQRLFDVCMGRIDPHPDHPAMVRRYITTPLLSLKAIGSYAIALAGLSINSQALEDLHLVVNGQPRPVPDEATILAIASQREGHTLTPDGWRRTPFSVAPKSPPSDSGQAIFLVPTGQLGGEPGGGGGGILGGVLGEGLGGVFGGVLGHGDEHDTPSTASECLKSSVVTCEPRSHGIMNQKDLESTTHSSAEATTSGGGGKSISYRRTAGRSVPPQIDAPIVTENVKQDVPPQVAAPVLTESAQALLAIGVRRSTALHLAERPVAQVTRVITQARARSDVRDLAAWVVSTLRDLPETDVKVEPEQLLSAKPIYFHPNLTSDERSDWLMRFRRATTAAEQRAILARLAEQHPQ